jgi:hypothetical protein
MKQFHPRFFIFLVLICVNVGPAATATATRFITVELWTGGKWNSDPAIRLPRVDSTFGNRGHKRIRGPIDWTRPGTGEVLKVYERTNKRKVQLFTIRRDKQGLGRVYDSRYRRDCVDAIKFPLGVWKQGETRHFTFSCNGGEKIRKVSITILNLDFEHEGVPHSLKYRWVVDGGVRTNTNNNYTYSPGKGMVDLEMNWGKMEPATI